MGLDVGDARIGVAVSDPTGTVVEPLAHIQAGTRASAIERIAEIVESEGVGEVVVGSPVSLDGSIGHQARKINSFAEHLAERISISVHLWDESYSSAAADGIMRESGARKSRKKGRRDSVAAAVILREYIQATRKAPNFQSADVP